MATGRVGRGRGRGRARDDSTEDRRAGKREEGVLPLVDGAHFLAGEGVETLEVLVRWGGYRRVEAEGGGPRLPSCHLDDGLEGLRRDLESLGVFQPLYDICDGWANIPDIFRADYYGLGLRGGVKLVR